MNPNDINKLRIIHEKFYREEFQFPDFFRRYHAAFVIEDDLHNIITAGGIRPIAESVAITNKDMSVKVRREALHELLKAHMYATMQCRYDQLHCFIQDETWLKHLQRVGFHTTAGQALVMEL